MEQELPKETENDGKGTRFAWIRPARTDDADALREIYAFYVENTTVSFEYEAPTVDEFRRRVDATVGEFPFFVSCWKNDRDGAEEIVGFAFAHRAFERAAYAWDAETTVYVDRRRRGRGVGAALYRALIETLRRQGFRNLRAIVTSENRSSVEFHLKNGFQLAGTSRRAGFKSGRWLDVDQYERSIGTFDANPTPPIPFSRLDPASVAAICVAAVRR